MVRVVRVVRVRDVVVYVIRVSQGERGVCLCGKHPDCSPSAMLWLGWLGWLG